MSVVVANPKNANEVSFDTQQRLLEQQKQEEEELRQKARKSPFSNFYQVNIDESPALRKCLDENPKALKLLFFILFFSLLRFFRQFVHSLFTDLVYVRSQDIHQQDRE